jgi:DNA polymerase-3 subunit epsilon
MALVWESAEIKRLWPEFNRSQKFAEPGYGLYHMTVQSGREILVVERKKRSLLPLYVFTQPADGLQMVRMLARQHGVDAALALGGELPLHVSVAEANLATQKLTEVLRQFLPSFLLKETGQDEAGRPREVYYCIKEGVLCGFAVMEPLVVPDTAYVLENLELLQDNSYVRMLLMSKAMQQAEALLPLD